MTVQGNTEASVLPVPGMVQKQTDLEMLLWKLNDLHQKLFLVDEDLRRLRPSLYPESHPAIPGVPTGLHSSNKPGKLSEILDVITVLNELADRAKMVAADLE